MRLSALAEAERSYQYTPPMPCGCSIGYTVFVHHSESCQESEFEEKGGDADASAADTSDARAEQGEMQEPIHSTKALSTRLRLLVYPFALSPAVLPTLLEPFPALQMRQHQPRVYSRGTDVFVSPPHRHRFTCAWIIF